MIIALAIIMQNRRMLFREFKDHVHKEMYKCYKDAHPDSSFETYHQLPLLTKIRLKHFQPNSNCVYLCRVMWYLYSLNGGGKAASKLIYKRIWHKYGCCIYPSAKVGKGFMIKHPVGIVIGNCSIGNDFTIMQGCTIGSRYFDNLKNVNNHPKIGNNVYVGCNSSVLGRVDICDDVVIGAHSLVMKDILQKGTYFGVPVK